MFFIQAFLCSQGALYAMKFFSPAKLTTIFTNLSFWLDYAAANSEKSDLLSDIRHNFWKFLMKHLQSDLIFGKLYMYTLSYIIFGRFWIQKPYLFFWSNNPMSLMLLLWKINKEALLFGIPSKSKKTMSDHSSPPLLSYAQVTP